MNKPPTSKTGWEKSAQNHFRKAEQTESSFKQVRRKERAADAVKTEKLRALRLAKEAADKEAQQKLAGEKSATVSGSGSGAKAKPLPKNRIIRY